MRLFVGVDGGGSKTTAAVSDETGRVVGLAVGGPSNYNALGIDVAAECVLAAISEAVGQAVSEADDDAEIAGLCLALAGVARPADHAAWRGAVTRWLEISGLRWSIRAEGAIITHDAMAALVGGTGLREGVVVIAGTGAIAFGATAHGKEARSSGWGYLLGDEGSGYWIGLQGLRAVCRADDGRGPATTLTQHLLAARSLSTPQELVRLIYSGWKPADVATLAPAVLDVAAGGDAVANEIVQRAAVELSDAALAVLRSLDLFDQTTEIVTAGSLWDGPLLRDGFAAQLHTQAPQATVIESRHPPVTGALLLARGTA
ncbi:MAG TPA: BadF/BadG/BcrA/BcrD ATPase family protein [Chloroflexota bacterium]|nr:BadF/BadG/BcrA/BcrD ATPase family protein [Chloroflexota bacterium]